MEGFMTAAKTKRPKQKYVFVKPDGSDIPKWYIERLLKKACEKAMVGPYRLHDLRHTYNTNMLKKWGQKKWGQNGDRHFILDSRTCLI